MSCDVHSFFRLRTHLWYCAYVFILLCGGCGNERPATLDVSMYQYRDTRDLLRFVYDAAQRLQQDGDTALAYFRDNRAHFRTQEHYLYVHDMNGINIFHAGMPELEGQDLSHTTDKNGRSIYQLTRDALNDPHNPHGWVHYSWWQPNRFYPVPKSSCNFHVTLDDGREFIVGGGFNYPHEEREFVRIIVDSAADLLREKGLAALSEINNPLGKFCFRDVRVFVFTADGDLLISPAITSVEQSGILTSVDEVGNTPFLKAINDLKKTNATWGVFMAKRQYRRELVKKSLYVRKVMLHEQPLFVAAITDLPLPPY